MSLNGPMEGKMPEQEYEAPAFNATDKEIEEMLSKYRIVAVVGLSQKPHRDSYRIAYYLKAKGYRVVPVNPKYDSVLGEKCYPSLSDIPFPVEIVDVFRRTEAVPPIADEAVKIGARVLWLQLGIVNNEAAEKVKGKIDVVMDRCIKIEYERCFGRKG